MADLLSCNLQEDIIEFNEMGASKATKRYKLNELVTGGYDINAVSGGNNNVNILNPIPGAKSILVGVSLVNTVQDINASLASKFTLKVSNKNVLDGISAALLDPTLNHTDRIYIPVMYELTANPQISASLNTTAANLWHLDVFFRPM